MTTRAGTFTDRIVSAAGKHITLPPPQALSKAAANSGMNAVRIIRRSEAARCERRGAAAHRPMGMEQLLKNKGG